MKNFFMCGRRGVIRLQAVTEVSIRSGSLRRKRTRRSPLTSLLMTKRRVECCRFSRKPKNGLTPISCHAALERSACAPFIKERRVECISATRLYRKSGQWGTQLWVGMENYQGCRLGGGHAVSGKFALGAAVRKNQAEYSAGSRGSAPAANVNEASVLLDNVGRDP